MKNAPIGVFDSGVGGISVLRKAVEVLPNEKFIYYGDSANAPYGTKSDDEVYALTEHVFETLLGMGAKAILVACNTATSVAVRKLRSKYPDLPLVGIEPAIKPAAENHTGGRIVVMATSVTLRRPKFEKLMDKYRQDSEIIPMPCPGLVEFIEKDNMDSPDMMEFLRVRFDELGDKPADAVVLGCTHYPFIRRQIAEIAGPQATLYDGSLGTARELRRRIEAAGLLADEGSVGDVKIINSAGAELEELSWKLFNKAEL